jgi:hypothetical protein
MVSSALRAVGFAHAPTFQTYHRILNRAAWSNLRASRILLRLLVAAFAADNDPLALGIDETIERRRGKQIAAAGIYRDPVRPSHRHFVNVNGLRCVCLILLAPIPWAGRVWALPCLTALAPAERSAQERHRSHKPVITWARQLLRQVHRWLPDQRLLMVGDCGIAALDLLAAACPVATLMTRLRLDAHLCAPPPPRAPGQTGRPRLVGKRLPTLEQWRDDAATEWTPLTIPRWYSEAQQGVEIVLQAAIWYLTGLPHKRFHDLRHTAATLLLEQGVPIKMVSAMLGHTSIAIAADIYSHVTPALERAAASTMDGIFRRTAG